jgi:hypothetical protein
VSVEGAVDRLPFDRQFLFQDVEVLERGPEPVVDVAVRRVVRCPPRSRRSTVTVPVTSPLSRTFP